MMRIWRGAEQAALPGTGSHLHAWKPAPFLTSQVAPLRDAVTLSTGTLGRGFSRELRAERVQPASLIDWKYPPEVFIAGNMISGLLLCGFAVRGIGQARVHINPPRGDEWADPHLAAIDHIVVARSLRAVGANTAHTDPAALFFPEHQPQLLCQPSPFAADWRGAEIPRAARPSQNRVSARGAHVGPRSQRRWTWLLRVVAAARMAEWPPRNFFWRATISTVIQPNGRP